MSWNRRKVCRFFNTQRGCRYGQRCSDIHESPSDEASSPSGSRPPGQKVSRAPGGKCNFYWSTGFCKRAFECKFEHVLSPSIERARKGADGSRDDSASDNLPDPSNPEQTHRYLKQFLKENFQFSTATQMSSFAQLLTNASSTNSSWTNDDGQLFLKAIASDVGCCRLSSILSYDPVSSTLHYNPRTLSFQRGYLPVFQYLSSKFVLKSTLEHFVNSLYAVLDSNLDRVISNLDSCIQVYISARSFKEKPSSPESSGLVVLDPIVTTFYEYLSRYKTALAAHKELRPFVSKLDQWIEEWSDGISSEHPTFNDLLTTREQHHIRELAINQIKNRMRKVVSIIDREQAGIDRSAARRAARDTSAASHADEINLIHVLETYYEGPGEERRDGPRHDNDFLDISDIQVAPTDEELTCSIVPFLPANIPNAPHPFPKDSMQRLLDIQFRLLREELLAPLRTSVQVMLGDMTAPDTRKTQLEALKKKKGGRYSYQDHRDSVMFNVYTNIKFARIETDSRRGLVVNLQFDTPPGSARSSKANVRHSYWTHGKRLMQGGLVAILWRRAEHIDVHLGILCSSGEKLAEAARASDKKLVVRVQFFDSIVNFKVLEHIRSTNKEEEERFMVESSVMFETVRPFLESLKRLPEALPFSRYLPHPSSGTLSGIHILPPTYSRAPGFAFNLECLQRDGDEDSLRGLRLRVTEPVSVEIARASLKERSKLDPSQAEAIVDALTREIALIQGPPGTGKTFIGVELMRVLIQNNVGPILLIAFTNHALDHMLTSVINNNITTNVVRLGGRSADEKIKRYSIEELERASGRSNLDLAMKSELRSIKKLEEQIMKLLQRVIGSEVPSHVLLNHLSILYPDHKAYLENPPSWIRELYDCQVQSDGDSWQEANRRGKPKAQDTSLYGFWLAGGDLKFLHDARIPRGTRTTTPLVSNRFEVLHMEDEDSFSEISSISDNSDSQDEVEEVEEEIVQEVVPGTIEEPPYLGPSHELLDAEQFFLAHGEPEIPQEPQSDRPLELLLEGDAYDVWEYSATERSLVHSYWVNHYRETDYTDQKEKFEDLIQKHADLRRRQSSRDEEVRLNIVRKGKVVGCTTTGAAKLLSLLKGLSPRVMIVEEAGQVLESHVLGSLIDSIEHLVLIGDPYQLRPTLNNYALSMDNPEGSKRYRFDMSLMERLSSTGLPMSRLDVQRRMRPEISSLIRDVLYPKLEDHESVLKYGSVRGIDKDVFFLTHGNKEHGGGDDSVSKHNPYEVDMIKDLVKYLLRQGCYSAEGQIVVLCAYLGQLVKVRDALKDEVAVIIDERDQLALAQHENEEGEALVERVHVNQRVKVRSVDNYQGEEADIIILSLVRNSGAGHGINEYDVVNGRTGSSIGFLKSTNRTNVALSRAKVGLYILGNAYDFRSRSPMWSSVIEQLEERGALGDALPIKCHRHPDELRYVSVPGDLPRASPDGGCLRNCGSKLVCGHTCPYKCHPDDEHHRSVFCTQPCPKLCPKGHPCPKQCAEACGKCQYPIRDVELPCGHVHKSVPCYQMDDLSEVKCTVKVEKDLPTCEHKVRVPCSSDVKEHKCQALCDGNLACCGKSCKAKCHGCQEPRGDQAILQVIPRTRHQTHKCGRDLYCGHSCSATCAVDHKCQSECQEKCRQSCAHAQCGLPCSKPCAPCLQACTWSCSHHSCPVPCGSVCARLPCDLRCEKMLPCGHQCPSVCGEDCKVQLCLQCAPKDRLAAIGDLILGRPLHDLEPLQETLDELIITLPDCRHAFTVETLDGHCSLDEYYDRDDSGVWRSMKLPQPGFKKPPACPTCRRSIRSPRYGRVYKRADLDILERNVAAHLDRGIHRATRALQSIDEADLRGELKELADAFHHSSSDQQDGESRPKEESRSKVLNSRNELPIPWSALDPEEKLHNIQPSIAKQWSNSMHRIKNIYMRALKIASERSAHVKAWESAFSSLHRQEIDNSIQNPATAARYPMEHAMRVARMKIGQTKPLADKRFCVEAFWLTIEIRFLLAGLAQEWLKPCLYLQGNVTSFKNSWSDFIAFLLKTCERDATIALRISLSSQSWKKALQSHVLIFTSRSENLKFAVHSFQCGIPTVPTRDDLLNEFRVQKDNLKLAMTKERERYRTLSGIRVTDAEFRSLFLEPTNAILEEIRALEKVFRTGIFYSPPSYEEKRQVLGALLASNIDLTYSGHFYQCPNGQPYVIGDCGGASETTRCPECNELVGGSDHSLLSSNRVNTELEGIARSQGVQQSPWPWAR